VNRQDAKVAKNGGVLEPSAELDELAHRVIGAAIEVHRLLGPGFLESRLGLLIDFGVDVLQLASSVSSEAHNLALLAP
jgi:hypothetical protein